MAPIIRGLLPYQRPLKLTSVIPTLSRQVRANHVNSEYHSEIHNTHQRPQRHNGRIRGGCSIHVCAPRDAIRSPGIYSGWFPRQHQGQGEDNSRSHTQDGAVAAAARRQDRITRRNEQPAYVCSPGYLCHSGLTKPSEQAQRCPYTHSPQPRLHPRKRR